MKRKAFRFSALAAATVVVLVWSGLMGRRNGSRLSADEWLVADDSAARGMKERWFAVGADRSEWSRIVIPEFRDGSSSASRAGIRWYARTIGVSHLGPAMSLVVGGVDDDAAFWVNGTQVGTRSGYSEMFSLDVGDAVRKGENEIVVRLANHGGADGLYAPVAIVPATGVADLTQSGIASQTARTSPAWVKDAVLYEVFLRSFSPEGTFKALEQRLPELKSLGVTVIWLMPVHPTGELNRKGTLGSPYAVQNYYAVSREYGTIEDFRSLVAAIHREGMHVILDLVINDTAWDNQLLLEHPEWYRHNNEGAIVSPNVEWTDVAQLNYDSHELRKWMIRMMRHWVQEEGVDGFRCDASDLVPLSFWETARHELDAIKPVMLLAEGTAPAGHVDAFDLTYSWNVYDSFGKVMQGSTPATIFDAVLGTESGRFPRGALRLRFASNHDLNAWDSAAVRKFGREGASTAAAMTFMLPGVPLVYNGDEAGNDATLDLFSKVPISWADGEDLRALYTTLATIRREHPAVREGECATVPNSGGPSAYSFLRKTSMDSVLTFINAGPGPVTVTIGNAWESERHFWSIAAGTNAVVAADGTLSVPGYGFAILTPSKR